MEIRVAADCFVGRCEFSAVVETQSTPGQIKESSSLVPRANLLGILHLLTGLKTRIVTESTADLLSYLPYPRHLRGDHPRHIQVKVKVTPAMCRIFPVIHLLVFTETNVLKAFAACPHD